jgi:hypothetical protein
MLKVRSRIAGFNPSTAVWTQHAKPAIWHAQIWNLLTQTIPGVFQKLALVAAIELFGSWGFKFPTPQWRILVISVISLGYFLEYLWYQLIYIYISIDINWYHMIHWKTRPFWHSACLRIHRSDHPIRFTEASMWADRRNAGPAKRSGGATVMPRWRESQGEKFSLFPKVIRVVSGWWVVNVVNVVIQVVIRNHKQWNSALADTYGGPSQCFQSSSTSPNPSNSGSQVRPMMAQPLKSTRISKPFMTNGI